MDGIHFLAYLCIRGARQRIRAYVLVTDAVMPAMCRAGPYKLGQVEVELRPNGSVVLRGGERLAGSVLRMDHAIANTVRLASVSLSQALAMAHQCSAGRANRRTPARSGSGRKGGLSALHLGSRSILLECNGNSGWYLSP